MKKNKLFILLLLFVVLSFSLSAVTIDEIIEGAKNNSPTYQTILLNYKNGLLSILDLEEKDKVGITLGADVVPLDGVENNEILVSPSVKVTLPRLGGTIVEGRANIKAKYDGTQTVLDGSLTASHSFDFSPYDEDKADDLVYASTKYQTEKTYREAELSFEKTVITTVSQIIEMEKSINTLEYNVNKQQKALDALNTLNSYSSSSPTFINVQNTLVELKNNLEETKTQYNNLLTSYKTLSGLDWVSLDAIEDFELEYITYENGNTAVLIESLKAEGAFEKLNEAIATYNPALLNVSLSLSSNNLNHNTNINLSATYTSSSWSVSAVPNFTIGEDGKVKTGVTISGRWSNNSNSNIRTVEKASNDAQSAQNSYLEKLSSYHQDVQSYSLRILNWENKKAQSKSDLELKRVTLENEEALYNLGISTLDSLDSARVAFENAEKSWQQVLLEGLSLQCELDIFAL